MSVSCMSACPYVVVFVLLCGRVCCVLSSDGHYLPMEMATMATVGHFYREPVAGEGDSDVDSSSQNQADELGSHLGRGMGWPFVSTCEIYLMIG